MYCEAEAIKRGGRSLFPTMTTHRDVTEVVRRILARDTLDLANAAGPTTNSEASNQVVETTRYVDSRQKSKYLQN